MLRAPHLLLALALSAGALAPPAAAQSPRPADVESLDGIVAALYESISGPAGEARDWDRLRSLFLPGARMIPTGPRPEGRHGARILTVEEYVTQVGPNLERVGFREREIARVTERFGGIAHAFSSYEGTVEAEPGRPMRGINSIQLMNDGERWWVVTIFWDAERPENPLPERYLRGGGR